MQKLSGKACTGVQGLSPDLSAHVLSEIFPRARKMDDLHGEHKFDHALVQSRLVPERLGLLKEWRTRSSSVAVILPLKIENIKNYMLCATWRSDAYE